MHILLMKVPICAHFENGLWRIMTNLQEVDLFSAAFSSTTFESVV